MQIDEHGIKLKLRLNEITKKTQWKLPEIMERIY